MRKSAKSLLLIGGLVVSGGLWAQQSRATTIRVGVDLINVFVTMTDEHGAPIGGLAKENFILKEDDREQRIAVFDRESALPISIALAIDTSLSTRHDLPLEQASAKRFAHAILRPIDAMSVYSFSEVVREAPSGYTADLDRK